MGIWLGLVKTFQNLIVQCEHKAKEKSEKIFNTKITDTSKKRRLMEVGYTIKLCKYKYVS